MPFPNWLRWYGMIQARQPLTKTSRAGIVTLLQQGELKFAPDKQVCVGKKDKSVKYNLKLCRLCNGQDRVSWPEVMVYFPGVQMVTLRARWYELKKRFNGPMGGEAADGTGC